MTTKWREDWHKLWTGDYVAVVDLDGQTFQLRNVWHREARAWYATVDFGFQHRVVETNSQDMTVTMRQALTAAQAWHREMNG